MSNVAQQLIAVQESVMHLQHELSQIHEVVLAQRDEIEELRRNLTKLLGQFEDFVEGNPFPSPVEDKPPHY